MLLAAVVGVGLFVLVEARAASPLIRLAMFRDPVLSAGLAMSALVSTVMMATLVVGPFYLSRALGLDAAHVGLVMSVGPLVAALTGVPAGRIVDRFGAHRMTIAGLVAMAVGCALLWPCCRRRSASPGYIAPLVVVTAGYALFQAANNTAVMTDVRPDQRGVISGMLNLSRNLGLITGASVMGAVFALASRRPTSRRRARGRRHRHADHIRGRGGADRRGARHRSRQPQARARFTRKPILTRALARQVMIHACYRRVARKKRGTHGIDVPVSRVPTS